MRGVSNQARTAAAMVGPMPAMAAICSAGAAAIAVEGAQVAGQLLGDGGPDVADVERDEQPLERSLRRRPGCRRCSLSTLRSFQPGQLEDLVAAVRQAEHVGQVVQPAVLAELRDGLLAEALDVEGAAGREVDERLRDAARAVDVLAEVVALALGAHERLAARRAGGRHLPRLGALRAAGP